MTSSTAQPNQPRTTVNMKALSDPKVIRRYFPIILFTLLCTFFAIMQPRFLTFSNAMIVLQQAVVLLVTALGMTFVIIGDSIDLSVGSIVALAALGAAMATEYIGMWAFVPAALIGIVCGLLNGLLFAKDKVPSFIATMDAMTAYRGIVLYFTKGAPVEIENNLFLKIFSGRSFGVPHSAVIAIVIVALAYVIFNNTVFRREVRAVGGGERVALLTGIKVDRVKLTMFVILGLLCGLAGMLMSARVMAATAQIGIGLELDVIAAVVVGGTPLSGGIGSIQGTILGTLIIAVLSNGMNMRSVDPYLQSLIKGIVLIVAVFTTVDRTKIGIIK